MVYKFFDEKSIGSGTAKPSSLERIASSSILADERHKPIIRKLIKEKYIRNLKIIYGE